MGQELSDQTSDVTMADITFAWQSLRSLHILPLMKTDLEIDALGLLCPLPVLRARKRMQGLEKGQIVCLLADDPAAVIDVPHFCAEAGHDLIASEEAEAGRRFFIRKG